jgi:uncharacterized protein
VNLHRRDDFLTFTSLFLFGLLLITMLLAWLADVQPLRSVSWSLWDASIGVGAAVLMTAVFSFAVSVREQAEEALGPSLAACTWYDLALLAVLVGIIEELLFRGVLEPWMARWSPVAAFVIVNVVFGLLHAVSWMYAVVAATLGCLLSLLAHGAGEWEFNLLRPIVAHAVYDYIGFVWIASSYRRSRPSPPEASSGNDL